MNVDNQVDNKLVFLVARASFNFDCLHMTTKPFMVSCWITPILPGFDLKLMRCANTELVVRNLLVKLFVFIIYLIIHIAESVKCILSIKCTTTATTFYIMCINFY